ncbi:MAG: hypothetical protein ACRDNM_00005, partial [Gaiellaceae bacterium]
MAGQPKKRAKEAAAAAARVGETYPPAVRPSAVAQTIAGTLPLVAPPVSASIFPPRSSFPGLGGGPRVVKGMPRTTAFDPRPPRVVFSPLPPPAAPAVDPLPAA